MKEMKEKETYKVILNFIRQTNYGKARKGGEVGRGTTLKNEYKVGFCILNNTMRRKALECLEFVIILTPFYVFFYNLL